MAKKNLLLVSAIKPNQVSLFIKTGVAIFYPEQLSKDIDPADINIMYGWKDDISSKVFNAHNSQLEWVHAISAGVDYLPLSEFAAHHILLTNASGIHAESISQSVLAYILHFVRGIDIATFNKVKHQWSGPDDELPYLVKDFSYIIFGTGHIGQQIARLLKSFGGHTIGINTTGHSAKYFDETLGISQLDQRIWKGNIIINVMPLTKSTYHFFNKTFFGQVRNLFLFINVGRGPVVDSTALINGLQTGHIQHAAIDVFEDEPLPANSLFWQLNNITITPHNTGIIRHFRNAQVALFLPNLTQYLDDGTFKTNQVDLSKGY